MKSKKLFKEISALIFAGTSGIYTYSLIVDGETIETKKMVKTK